MKCIVCGKELTSPFQPCTGCGFVQPAVVGDAAGAQAFIASKAEKYKQELLEQLDFGIMIFRWKDDKGTLVLDTKERLSFGSGKDLLNRTLWLDQQFARLPDMNTMQLQLSVRRLGLDLATVSVSIPVPQGCHLQQVGLELRDNFTLQLKLKNPQEQTTSEPVEFPCK